MFEPSDKPRFVLWRYRGGPGRGGRRTAVVKLGYHPDEQEIVGFARMRAGRYRAEFRLGLQICGAKTFTVAADGAITTGTPLPGHGLDGDPDRETAARPREGKVAQLRGEMRAMGSELRALAVHFGELAEMWRTERIARETDHAEYTAQRDQHRHDVQARDEIVVKLAADLHSLTVVARESRLERDRFALAAEAARRDADRLRADGRLGREINGGFQMQ